MKEATTTGRLPRLRQLTATLESLARRAASGDPVRPAWAVFGCIMALMAIGFLLQASHAATTLSPEVYQQELTRLVQFRILALIVMALAFRAGPRGIERHVPWLTAVVVLLLLLVYLPPVNAAVNGSRRWLKVPFIPFTLQPSELARVVAVLWVALHCRQLGKQVEETRSGYLPMFFFGMGLFILILLEPDVGGSLLFLICFMSTMWVGGARPAHLAGSGAALIAGALLFCAAAFSHAQERIAIWLGHSTNDQVTRAAEAMASGKVLGVGLTHGGFRNQNLQYMQTDYALSLVGEELGLLGVLVVLGLLLAYVVFSFRLVASLRDRYLALTAFGLLVSVAFQGMLHVQVVTGLAPPKGMPLPFVSEGGSALVASSLAIGLALGAARQAQSSKARSSKVQSSRAQPSPTTPKAS